MPHVQIRYADVPHNEKKVRLIRFDNEPHRPSSFFSGFGGRSDEAAFEEDPNSHLAEAIQKEVSQLFKADNIPLYFDSTELVFSPADEVRDFRSEYVDDEDYQWQKAILKAQYE